MVLLAERMHRAGLVRAQLKSLISDGQRLLEL
jgi:hypothetical protein